MIPTEKIDEAMIIAVLTAWWLSIIIQQAFDDQLFLEPLIVGGKLCRLDELVIGEDGMSISAKATALAPPESINITMEVSSDGIIFEDVDDS